MGKPVFPPRFPTLREKGDVSLPLSPSLLMGRPLLPQCLSFTPQHPLICKLTPLLSIPTSPISSIHTIILFIFIFSFLFLELLLIFYFKKMGASNPTTPPPSSSLQSQLTPVPFCSLTVIVSYTICRSYLTFSTQKTSSLGAQNAPFERPQSPNAI